MPNDFQHPGEGPDQPDDQGKDKDYEGPQPGPPPEYPPGEMPIGPQFDGQPTVPMVMSDFIGYLENVARLAKLSIGKPPEGQFYCVVVPPTGKAACHTHPDVLALVEELRGLYGKDTQVFAFSGTRLKTSKGGDYLFTPWGNHALFTKEPTEAEDDDGFMGSEPQLIQPPPPPPEPEVEDDEDEEEDP